MKRARWMTTKMQRITELAISDSFPYTCRFNHVMYVQSLRNVMFSIATINNKNKDIYTHTNTHRHTQINVKYREKKNSPIYQETVFQRNFMEMTSHHHDGALIFKTMKMNGKSFRLDRFACLQKKKKKKKLQRLRTFIEKKTHTHTLREQ